MIRAIWISTFSDVPSNKDTIDCLHETMPMYSSCEVYWDIV